MSQSNNNAHRSNANRRRSLNSVATVHRLPSAHVFSVTATPCNRTSCTRRGRSPGHFAASIPTSLYPGGRSRVTLPTGLSTLCLLPLSWSRPDAPLHACALGFTRPPPPPLVNQPCPALPCAAAPSPRSVCCASASRLCMCCGLSASMDGVISEISERLLDPQISAEAGSWRQLNKWEGLSVRRDFPGRGCSRKGLFL